MVCSMSARCASKLLTRRYLILEEGKASAMLSFGMLLKLGNSEVELDFCD